MGSSPRGSTRKMRQQSKYKMKMTGVPTKALIKLPSWTVTFLPIRLVARRRAATGLGVPVVNARFLVAPQHAADLRGDDRVRRRVWQQQTGEDFADLRHRQSRDFPPLIGLFPIPRTTELGATASCDDASPPNCAPRSGSVRHRLCLPRTTPRFRAVGRGRLLEPVMHLSAHPRIR